MADRVSDAFLLGGVAWYLSAHHHGQAALIPFAILAVTFLISYQRAKAELLGLSAKGGLMERAERFVLLGGCFIAGAVSAAAFVPALWIFLALVSATAVGRFVKVWNTAEGPPRRRPPSRPPPRGCRAGAVGTGAGARRSPVGASWPTPAGGPGARPGRNARAWGHDRWCRSATAGSVSPVSGCVPAGRPRPPTAPGPPGANAGPRVSSARSIVPPTPSDPEPGPVRDGRDGTPHVLTGSGGRRLDRDRVVYLSYRTLGAGLASLPEPAAATIATLVGQGMGRLGGARRDMYVRHLGRILGPGLTDAEVRRWVHRAFVSYARYWFEGARLPSTPSSVVNDHFVVESGMEHLVDGMRAGHGVIMALPHIGSWEWGGAWLANEGYPMISVAEPLEPPELYEWFVSEREAMGLTILPLDDNVGSALLRSLGAGRLVGLLCDRDLAGNGIEVEFFGEKTTLPAGPAMLALRTGAPLLPTAVYQGPGKGHTAVIGAPLRSERTGRLRDDVTRVTRLMAVSLEALIRRAPEQWHVFQPNWPSDHEGPVR